MSVLVGGGAGEKAGEGTLLVKGATEMVLGRCSKARLLDGTTVPLTPEARQVGNARVAIHTKSCSEPFS